MSDKFPYVVKRKSPHYEEGDVLVAAFATEEEAADYCTWNAFNGHGYTYAYSYERPAPRYILTTVSSYYGEKSHRGMTAEELEKGFRGAFQRLRPGQCVKYEITRQDGDA